MSTRAAWNHFSRFTGTYGPTNVNSVSAVTRENVINRVFGGWTRRQLAIIDDINEMLFEMHKEDFHPHREACIECQCHVLGKALADY